MTEWIFDSENIDGWHLDSVLMLAVDLEDIEREKFGGSLAKCLIYQYFHFK